VIACIHVGADAAGGDAGFARNAGMEWRTVDVAAATALLANGGPYYVYGPAATQVRDAVQAHFPRPVALE
jgi:hypothetical protein